MRITHTHLNILVGNTVTRKIPFLQHHAHLCFQSSIQYSGQRLALSCLLHNAEHLSDHILVTVMQGLPQLCQAATLCQHLVDSRRCLLHLCQTQQVHRQLNTDSLKVRRIHAYAYTILIRLSTLRMCTQKNLQYAPELNQNVNSQIYYFPITV